MILQSLRLRGAIGIQKGLDKEEVNIDFRQFAPGLIAVVGPNGAGKTTLLENLTPFRFLRSHPGSLARQFYLKDSSRDLLVKMNGDELRFLININGNSGRLESYVYKNGEALNPDGKEGSYNEIVTGLFGEPSLFFSSLFMPQHRSRFSDLDPKESKILLLKLIGAERVQTKCDFAATKAKEISSEITKLEFSLQAKIEALTDYATVDADISETQEAVERRTGEIARVGVEIGTLNDQLKVAQSAVTAQEVTQAKLDQARGQLNDLLREQSDTDVDGRRRVRQLRDEILSLEIKLSGLLVEHTTERLKMIETRVAKAAAAKVIHLALTEKAQQHANLSSKLSKTREDYSTAKAAHEAGANRLKTAHQQTLSALSAATSSNEHAIENMKSMIERKRRATAILNTVPCQSLEPDIADTCKSCQFLKDALQARDEIATAEQALSEAESQWIDEKERLSEAVTAARTASENFGDFIGSADESRLRQAGDAIKSDMEALGFDSAEAARIKAEHEAFERENPVRIRAQWDIVTQEITTLEGKATDLQARLEAAEKESRDKLANIDARLSELNARIEKLESAIDEDAAKRLSEASAALEKARSLENFYKEELAALRPKLVRLQGNKKISEDISTDIETIKADLAKIESEQADWNHLAINLSRNGGFQSLLVESAGAEMSPFADQMLAQYGRSWTMEFATARPSDDGKKMIEGFYVTINTPDGPRNLGDLSGGEEVIADQVIYDAIGNMLRRRSGLDLRTAIKDEADGALDSDRAIDYLQAVQAAHEVSGLHHTIIISHRPELQEMIAQRIRLVPGSGIEVELG